ncbi:MAG: Tol-Pal system beta propeller repeat protein TolB [Thermodesulfovibrionales bacterium]|nr:Tol-Pal system beta propeller repeat protein TolB [Thermodesulfovibrionales bacterium]
MKKMSLQLFFILIFLSLTFSLGSSSRVYIDVNLPNLKPLPIAIQTFTNLKELSDIIIDDLSFTGLFECIPENAQVERNEQAFNARSWIPLNVALVVKGRVNIEADKLNTVITVFDVTDNKEVLRKEYSASKSLLRPLAHTISNDIYKILTGQQGIFRTKIAFIADRGNQKEIYISDYDGQRGYGTGIKGGILLTPKWSHDGSTLIYSAERDRNWSIYKTDMAEMREISLVSLKGLNMVGNFFPDGKSFVFSSSKDGKSDIHMADTDTMKGYKIVASPWIDVSPSLSRDGKQLVFVSNRSGSPQIYIADSNGNNIRRITFEGNYNTSPNWSPNGDRIVFTSMIGGKQQIFTIKTDGSSLQKLTDKGSNEDPMYSPDGRYIVFSSDREGSSAIYIMRANGEGQKRITPRGLRAYGPSWSPN